MNRRKKQIYASVITVIGVALIYDLTTGGGRPGPTIVLGATKVSNRRSSDAKAGLARAAGPTGPCVLLPARFPGNLPVEQASGRDVFGLTNVVRQVLLKVPESSSSEGNSEGGPESAARMASVFSVEQFRADHTVSAVVSSGAFTAAFVDGAWMGIGQSLDGCELVHIHGQTVIFDCPDEAVELSVETTEIVGENR